MQQNYLQIALKIFQEINNGLQLQPLPTEDISDLIEKEIMQYSKGSNGIFITEETEAIARIVDCYKLLVEYPKFAHSLVSRNYPFKQYQLLKHQNKINWWGVSLNHKIKWQKIEWQKFTGNLIHCEEGMEEMYDDNCVECSNNKYFPWCEELIEHWQRKVNWCYLAQNPIFLEHTKLVLLYQQYLDPHKELMSQAHKSFNTVDDIITMQKERFPCRIKFIRLFPFVEQDLFDNMEMLWAELFGYILNDDVVNYLLPIVFQKMNAAKESTCMH